MAESWLDRRLTWLVASGLVVGVGIPPLAAILKSLLSALIVGVIAIPLLRLLAGFGGRVLLPNAGRLLLLLWYVLGGFLTLWGVSYILPVSQDTLLILLLVGASPPLLASPAFAQMIGLEAHDLAFVGLAGTLLAPLSLPLCLALSGLSGTQLDLLAVGRRFIVVLAVAVLLAILIYRWLGAVRLRQHNRSLARLGAVPLFLVAIALMDGVPAFFQDNPGQMVLYTLLAFAVNLGLQALGYGVFRLAGRQAALAAAIAGGNRNLALTLAAIGSAAPTAFEVYVAMGQLPIFLLPALLAPLYRRLHQGSSVRCSPKPG